MLKTPHPISRDIEDWSECQVYSKSTHFNILVAAIVRINEDYNETITFKLVGVKCFSLKTGKIKWNLGRSQGDSITIYMNKLFKNTDSPNTGRVLGLVSQQTKNKK